MTFFQQHKKQATIATALLLLAIFFLGWWIKTASIEAYAVKKQDYVPSLLLSGEVIPGTSTLLSTQTSGTVLQSLVKKGDLVKKGQIILELDDRQARLARDRAEEALKIARSNLRKASTVTLEEARLSSVQADLEAEQAQRQYDRIQTLAAAGAVSQQDLEEAEQNLKLSRERSRSARIAMEALQNHGVSLQILESELQQRTLDLAEKELLLEHCRIAAPLDGIIVDLYMQTGELLQIGSKVALIASSEHSMVRIKPDQRYAEIAALHNHAEVWISAHAESKWPAQVTFTEPAGNADQGSLTAELSLEKHVPELYPGRLVSVQLFGPLEKQGVIVADAYLTVHEGNSGVWIARNNRARFTPLKTGMRTPEGVLIRSGLQEGDLLLSPDGLQEGQRVNPKVKGID